VAVRLQCVREITLQSDIKNVCHGVQLTTGQFVVCHGLGYDGLQRVCLVDKGGRVTRSYGGQYGSGDLQLNYPFYLAVDEDSQFVFVADSVNNRVVMLSPKLEFVRDFKFTEKQSWPHQLYFHHTTHQLYVCRQKPCGVDVIQL